MDERHSKASARPQEFDDLVAELGDLVETLGLEEDAPPARRPARPPGRRGPRPRAATSAAVATPEVESPSEVGGATEVEDAPEVPPEPELGDLLDDTTFWVPPAEMLEPGGRPWSPAAAMELLPSTRGGAAPAAVVRAHSGWLMTLAASTAVALAVFALVVSHLDLASTGGPEHAVSAAPFTVSTLRTVAADSASAVASAPSTTRFGATTNHLFVDIHYTGATPHDSLELKVIRDSEGLPPPSVVQDHTYRLDTPTGQGVVTVELTAPPGTAFAPGRYTVSVVHGQSAAQTVDFTVGTAGG
jgi:hypothetical protein